MTDNDIVTFAKRLYAEMVAVGRNNRGIEDLGRAIYFGKSWADLGPEQKKPLLRIAADLLPPEQPHSVAAERVIDVDEVARGTDAAPEESSDPDETAGSR